MTNNENVLNKYFLPYQREWINDNSRFKFMLKSRRTGITHSQSCEDVIDCLKENVPAVWFSSRDTSASKLYIEDCAKFAKMFNLAADYVGEDLIDDDQVTLIRFKNGTKIVALSSSPDAFRSKGGKLILDEFAFHKNQKELWKAARPITTSFGLYPARIISTLNGNGNFYYQMWQDIKAKRLPFSFHYIDIFGAVKQGLLDKILNKPTTEEERKQFIADEKAACADENSWLQEYCCIPIDETSSFLTYDLIRSCEINDLCPVFVAEKEIQKLKDYLIPYLQKLKTEGKNFYIGMDVGREKDLSVIWIKEKIGAFKYTRCEIDMLKMPYSLQEEIVDIVYYILGVIRGCFDATGIGDPLAERIQEKHGKNRAEKVKFTAQSKEALATDLKLAMEDRRFLIPADEKIRKDFHSIKKTVTSSGNIRFDAVRTGTDGHADRFWAAALANHACDNTQQPIINVIGARKKRESWEMIQGY